MRLFRVLSLSFALAAVPAAVGMLAPHDAEASVMIAVPFDSLVKDADTVAVVLPEESKSVWENGRIYTYTRVRVDQGVAGELARGSEGWVRTMGGVVGEIGQLVDGEPVLAVGKPSLLFLRKFKAGSSWEVSARAQGQYPVVLDDASKTKRVIPSANLGLLLPPKAASTQMQGQGVQPQSGPAAKTGAIKVRLAQEVLADRALDDAAKEIASAWKRLHPPPPPATK